MTIVFIFFGCSDSNVNGTDDINYTVPVAIDSKNSPPTPPSLEEEL